MPQVHPQTLNRRALGMGRVLWHHGTGDGDVYGLTDEAIWKNSSKENGEIISNSE
jgi:hypothetical protein